MQTADLRLVLPLTMTWWKLLTHCWNLAPTTASLTISFQPAWKVRRHWGCSREIRPAFWRQKGQVAAADFRRLERGIVSPRHYDCR